MIQYLEDMAITYTILAVALIGVLLAIDYYLKENGNDTK